MASPRRRRRACSMPPRSRKKPARAAISADGSTGAPASIDPLAYTLELARIAKAAGVRIAEREHGGRAAARGRRLARCDRIRRGIAREIRRGGDQRLFRRADPRPRANHRAAALLPDRDGAVCRPILPRKILPEGQAVSDSRRILVYYRKSPDGRLVLGGRGRMALPKSADDWAHLQRAMLRLYPALAGVRDRTALVRPRRHDAGPPAAHP